MSGKEIKPGDRVRSIHSLNVEGDVVAVSTHQVIVNWDGNPDHLSVREHADVERLRRRVRMYRVDEHGHFHAFPDQDFHPERTYVITYDDGTVEVQRPEAARCGMQITSCILRPGHSGECHT